MTLALRIDAFLVSLFTHAMMTRVIRAVLAGGLVLGLGCAALAAPVSQQPKNLFLLKQEIRAYVESGRYDQDIAAVTADAGAWLDERVKLGGTRLAVVFDLDETLFSNWPHFLADDFAYLLPSWDAWVGEGRAPAIAPVRELGRQARRLGIDVILLTGRRERDRPGTEKNLHAIDCDDYAMLIFMPDASKETTGAFKLAQRRRLLAEGYVIIANVGDQESDFEGGGAERTFKLPNPFYLTK